MHMMQGIGYINNVQPPMFLVINALILLNVLINNATVAVMQYKTTLTTLQQASHKNCALLMPFNCMSFSPVCKLPSVPIRSPQHRNPYRK